ncbi:hypothetical protein OK016_12055 [Vibrio chagasii]|nr:hypothetical protein [Vibrio chagasii]
MGADRPLAILSHQSQHLQPLQTNSFAQVTNPPIDPIRERMVMSLNTYLGKDQNLPLKHLSTVVLVELESPVPSNPELEKAACYR